MRKSGSFMRAPKCSRHRLSSRDSFPHNTIPALHLHKIMLCSGCNISRYQLIKTSLRNCTCSNWNVCSSHWSKKSLHWLIGRVYRSSMIIPVFLWRRLPRIPHGDDWYSLYLQPYFSDLQITTSHIPWTTAVVWNLLPKIFQLRQALTEFFRSKTPDKGIEQLQAHRQKFLDTKGEYFEN